MSIDVLCGGHKYILLVLCRNAFLLQMLVRAEFHVLFAGLFPVEAQTSTANKHPLKIHGRTYRDWQDCCGPAAALKGLWQRVPTSDGARNRICIHLPDFDWILWATHRSLIQGNTALLHLPSAPSQVQIRRRRWYHDVSMMEWIEWCVSVLSAQFSISSYFHIGLSQILPGCYWWKAGQAAWLPVSQVAREDLWGSANNSSLFGLEVRWSGWFNGNLDSKEERLLRPTFWKALPHLRWRSQHAGQGYIQPDHSVHTHVTTMIYDLVGQSI